MTKVVAMMTKKVKSLRWDVEREQAIYATHAHRVISIALKPRGDRGAPGPQGPIGNTVSVTRAALGRGVTVEGRKGATGARGRRGHKGSQRNENKRQI